MIISDIRNLNIDDTSYLLPELDKRPPLLTARQVAALVKEIPRNAFITVPDFLKYARLLKSGNPLSLLADIPVIYSIKALLNCAFFGVRHPLKLATMDFWFYAEILMKYDLSILPESMNAPVFLHYYLADFAFILEKKTFMKHYFQNCGVHPKGIHTQHLALAMSCLSRWNLKPDYISYLGDDSVLKDIPTESAFPKTQFIRDLAYLPHYLQRGNDNVIVSRL